MRAITWVVLLAFALQSFIAQTHFHGAVAGHDNGAIVKALAKGSSPARPPSGNDGADCPFCQALMHVGVFSTPSTPALLQPLSWGRGIAVPLIVDAIARLSARPWQSRAPPRR